jgi:CBS domain-containing protein
MRAKDFMTTDVVTIDPDSDVTIVAQTFLDHRISAAPVVDRDGVVVGVVSEGDLMRRARPEKTRRSWWLSLVADPTTEFVRNRGTRARDIMTPTVVSVSGEKSLSDVACILESNNIKRVPVIEEGRLVGLVSRADILRCLAAGGSQDHPTPEDQEIRKRIIQLVRQETEAWLGTIKVIVTKGEVHLWGTVDRKADADAVRVAAESVVGVNKVHNHLSVP